MNVAVAHDLEEFFKIFLVLVSLLWEGWPGATQHLGGNFLPEKLVWKCSSPHQPDASEFFRGKFGEYIWTLNSVWGKYKRKKRFKKRRKRDQTEGTLSEHSIKRASLLFSKV